MGPRGRRWWEVGAGVTEALHEPIIGTYDHTIDGKGRVVLPQVYRGLFQDGVKLSNRGEYLAVFPAAEWRRYSSLLEERCLGGQVPRRRLDRIYANTFNATLDSQGRVLVTQRQRDAYGLVGDVRFRGHGNHLGLYPRVTDEVEDDTESLADIFADLSAIGL